MSLDEPVDREVQDVLREERARGRQPVDTDAEREQRELVEKCRELILGDDEAGFCEALTALGYSPDSPRFQHFVAFWRSLRPRRA